MREIDRIATFLDVRKSEEFYSKISKKCSFSELKQSYKKRNNMEFMFRKGKHIVTKYLRYGWVFVCSKTFLSCRIFDEVEGNSMFALRPSVCLSFRQSGKSVFRTFFFVLQYIDL